MILTSFHITRKKDHQIESEKKLLTSQMADSEKAPEQQQQAPAKTEGSKNDNASNPPTSEEQQPKQIIGEFKKNRQTDRTRVIQRDANENQIILSQ